MYMSSAGAFAVLSSKLDLLGTCSATRQRAAASATPAVVAQVSPACLQLRLRDIDGPAQRRDQVQASVTRPRLAPNSVAEPNVPTTSSRRKRGCDSALGGTGLSNHLPLSASGRDRVSYLLIRPPCLSLEPSLAHKMG